MKKFFALILFIFSSIIFLFLSPKIVSAAILFQDDFDDGNADGWTLTRSMQWDNPTQPCLHKGQPAQWMVKDRKFGISIEGPGCVTEIVPHDALWNSSWNDYIFEVDMEFVQGTDKNLAWRYTADPSQWYGLHFYGDKVMLQRCCGSPTADGPFPNGNTYHVKVVIDGFHFVVYIGGVKKFDVVDTNKRFPTGKIALQASVGADPNSEVWFDNIIVSSIEPEPTPTPTPTPTLEPLILLPGLGGSWNHQEIFLGIDQPQSEWHKTPFIDNYNGLLQTLQNAGYSLGETLFIFYYDWLQPIFQTANHLKAYIDTVVNPPPETKVDLLGHSLGGLVARTYIQNNPGFHHVDQLITLGSPHKGVPQVYKAWEGADLHDLLGDKERIGAGILLRIRGFGYPNLVEAIQDLVPSLGNLLFIDDYLKMDNNGMIKPEPAMNQQNMWLKHLGTSRELFDLTNTVLGTAGDTPRWLKIIERSKVAEKLGRWEDGRPVGEEFAIGDKTVLEESARLEGANIITLDSLDHGELVESTTGQEKILELLGVPAGVEIVEQSAIPFEPALIFTVASPANLRVTDPLGRQIGAGIDVSLIPNAIFSAEEKIIIIPQAAKGKYKVEVISENDGGAYRLLVGQLTEKQDIWTSYQGEVASSDTDTYILPFDSTLQTTKMYLADLINLKLKNLLFKIQGQNLNFRVKTKLTAKILEIFTQTKLLPAALKLERNRLAIEYIQKAIFKTIETIDYVEKSHPDSLLSLREILDLLGQLEQLLT